MTRLNQDVIEAIQLVDNLISRLTEILEILDVLEMSRPAISINNAIIQLMKTKENLEATKEPNLVLYSTKLKLEQINKSLLSSNFSNFG